ncbi:MAG: thiamine pyrophosphate-dependent dehydrogenase E1 component subunit alpha [Pseudomonadota bacterium]
MNRIRHPDDIRPESFGLIPANTPLEGAAAAQVFREMVRIRRVEERIGARYAEQEMRCPTHLCIGHEAPPAAVCAHLRAQDLVFSNHRSHGHYLAKGADLKGMIAELYGRATGCADGKGGSQHLIDLDAGFMGSAPILASTISVGVGAAWAAKLDGRDEVSAIFFGDGATEEGTFHEAMNYAAVASLPVVFVCENNLYSVHSDMDIRQSDRPVAALGPAHGMPAAMVDGNDAGAIWQSAATAVARAIAGEGPSLIECVTYRWREHCGPNEDVALGYRSQQEFDAWAAHDPLVRSRTAGLAQGWLSESLIAEIEQETTAEIDAAFDFAVQSPFPEAHELTTHIYPGAA